MKEISATILALENRLMTYSEAWAQHGGDFEEGMEKLLLEAPLLQKVRQALPLSGTTSQAAASTPGRRTDGNDTNTKETTDDDA